MPVNNRVVIAKSHRNSLFCLERQFCISGAKNAEMQTQGKYSQHLGCLTQNALFLVFFHGNALLSYHYETFFGTDVMGMHLDWLKGA